MPNAEHITAAHIARLWERMAQIYGHKWTTHFGARDTGDTWLRGLQDLTPELIAGGIEACLHRRDPWPPNLPEFRMLALGLPSAAEIAAAVALLAAGRGGEVDPRTLPVARRVYRRIGEWDASRMTERDMRRAIDGHLPRAIADESTARIEQARLQLAHAPTVTAKQVTHGH